MKLGGRRPGMGTSFVDANTSDLMLQVVSNEKGEALVLYRLYDCTGALVADSDGSRAYPEGIEIRDSRDELLLLVPSEANQPILYRLYSRAGELLTCSDGARTQLFKGIRLEPTKLEGYGTIHPGKKTPAINAGTAS